MRANPKNRRRYGWILLLIAMSSCFKTNQSVNPAHSSILQFIAGDSSLSLLNTAIQRVQLDTAMSSGGPFTFFAPSDSAFRAAGLTADSINRMDAQKLLLILKYMVVNGRLSATDVPGFLKQQFSSLHPSYKPFISKSYYGIFINGIVVTHGDIELGDGVLQVIGRVAFPPAGSQLDVLDQSRDMKFFAALVRHVYTFGLLVADPNPNSSNSGQGYYYQVPVFGNTLLVPTDSAFIAYGYPDSVSVYNDSLKLIDGYFSGCCNYVAPILVPYVLNGFDFTSDFKGEFQLNHGANSLGYRWNGILNIWTSMDGMSFTGNGIALDNPVKIIGPDLIATNGVVQKINQVFITH